MRDKLFRWLLSDVRKHIAGEYLPLWLRVLWNILFPMKAIYYRVGSKEGYQPCSDTWKIHGHEYSDELFRFFAYGDDRWFRVEKRENGVITIETKLTP